MPKSAYETGFYWELFTKLIICMKIFEKMVDRLDFRDYNTAHIK